MSSMTMTHQVALGLSYVGNEKNDKLGDIVSSNLSIITNTGNISVVYK